MKLTLENPPLGYLPEAEFRSPKYGEYVLGVVDGGVVECRLGGGNFRVVLTPDPACGTRPDWLPKHVTTGWLARNEEGYWAWHSERPYRTGAEGYGYWQAGAGTCHSVPAMWIHDTKRNVPWRESLICCIPEN